MDRRRGAAALLALAACMACSSAAPTASNPTALELHDGPTEGCYYNFQHYGEGDRIMTNEPCLNCTCHNRMLMCYLRVCPFTKAIGQDCTVEKRADQCCPIVTCPDVPVDLLTSTSTSSPAEYGPTGIGKLDKYGCSIHNKYFPEGSKVPSSPNKPCEHCYCIRNMTTCVMQECTLHVDGCTPIYHKDVCCPVRYSCDHSEDEIRLLDDMTTTVRPTQGFLLTTTTMTPVTQMTQDCIHEEQIFPDGASIKTDKACEHCYCMKGDIVCVVQECGTPMENEGKNCKSLPPRQGQCCPDTYICEGDEPSLDLTTETIDLTSGPPRRLGVEGSGYRNEPDEPITERGPFEHDIEGSGDVSETDLPTKVSPTIKDELLLISTEKDALYSQTTEADKYLNPNTGQISEKEPSLALGEDSITQSTESILLTSTESKVTIAEEVITSDGVTAKHEDVIFDTEAPTHSYEPDKILPTDISIDKETSINIPEQSTTMDEHSGYSVTEITTSIKKEPETGSTDSVAPYDVTTTEHPIIFSVTEKDKSNDESSEINKIDIDSEMTNADVSVTEQNKPDFDYSTVKEVLIIDDETTVSSNKDAPETTSINPVDNEVDYIPGRIPGEGDCLLNGVTYSDNTSVPSTNNCHTGCKCISSIIKCDPIICSPPPEYMENMNDCQTSYDSPDACCPTFVCSAKETSLPQSHSQTSVTESSKPVAVEECNGNDCSSSEVKQPSIEPHIICDLGNCESGPKQNDCGINGCQGEEQHPLDRPVDCSGDKCSVSPTVSCEGENCETAPTEEKDVDEKTHTVSPNKPICNNDGGCDNMQDTSSTQDECNDETCRRKETFETNTNIHSECSGTDCKIDNVQKIPLIEPTIAPVTENILNDINTETNSDETQKTASPVPSIITPEKAITTESSTAIGIEPATIKEQLPDKIPTDIPTEEPIKLVTDSATGITQDTATKIDNTDRIVTAITDNPQEAIIKSETPPTELIPMSDSATEITKTSDEGSVSQEFYTRAPGQDESETFTESRLVDYTSENVDTSSQEYTKETSQTTTQKSEAHSDIYETKPAESVTKLPIVMDIEKEINKMEIPNLPATEVKVTAESEDYPVTTEKLEALSVSDEKVGITLQPTKMQDNVETELPESAMEIEGGNEDHSELIPTEAHDLTSKIIQDGKTEDYNKFTTVKGITSPGVTENPEPVQTETQAILLETVSSESTISTEIHKTYTEVPQTVGTKSDIAVDSDSYITVKLDESNNKFEEPTTPSLGAKQPEEFSTKSDETIFGDGHSEAETEKQEYATTERKPSILNDDKLNVDLNLDVTERQTTISQMKNIDENEIEQEIQTKLPIVDKITERTELQITTESHKESEMGDFMDRDSQTIGVTDLDLNKDFVVTESAHPYTSNDEQQPASETTSKDQNLDLQSSTTSQDIFATKDTSTAPVLRDEGNTEIASSTDKNIIKITTSSEESVTETKYVSEVAGDEELTTPLPNENVEPHQPTEDLKLTTVHLESPIETTTSVLISEEKQQTPDLGTPEKPMEEENESVKDMTTELPSYTKYIIDEEISSSRSPELISPIGDTTDIPSDKEKETTSSISNTKEEDVPENNLQEITPTTISNIHISESVTEKINMQPEEHLTQESSAEGSSEKPDANENNFITESSYSQTSSIDFDKYSTIPPDEYAVDQTPKLPVSEINNDIKPIYTSIPLLTQDDEIITEKTGTEEKESSTEKAEYDVITVKNEQPLVAMSTESNTDQDIFPDIVTEDKHIEIMDKVTEISPAANESEKQNIGSSSSVQENENPSSEVLKQTTEVQFESELTTQQEHQTVASIPKDQSNTELSFEGMPTSEQTYTSSSKPYIEIEDVGTTESVPIKEEDSPIHPEMPVENIYTINDLMTTEVVPSKHDELPKHPETTSMDTVLPELDRTEGEQGISKIDSDTLTTESLITSKPSLFTSTEIIKTDTTKLIDMLEEQPLPSKVPEPVLESTSQSETEGVTEQEDTEPYTTEKQYVSKSDQEEVPKIPELPVEQITAQTDTETVSKQEDFGTFTTEKQYVTKSDQGDIPKIPVLVDEQSNSQSDIESVTKFDDTESYNTEKQYVTKSDQDDIPKTPMLVDEQSNSQSDIESVTKIDDTESYNTEKQYVTKSDQDDISNTPGLVDEQSNSQTDIESVTKSDDTESYNTEKQYVTESDEEVPEIPKLPEDQSTDQTHTENISKTEDSQSITTEGTYVTKLEQEIPKLPEQIEEQSTSHADIESVTKLEDSEPLVTEKQYVTKSDQEEAPKVTVLIDEQSTSPSDTESITKLNDIEPYTTEKQYVTKSVEDEVPKIPEPSEEESTARTDTEVVSKQEDFGSTTTEKQYVTKSVDEEIPKIPVLIDEQAISQSDVEGVTKLDDMEPFVTEKQYITNSEQEEIPKIPVVVDEESTSQSDVESITKLNDIEPFTTEKQFVTISSERVPETPELPNEQSTDRSDIEVVSKTEDAGPFTTERPYVTKLEQEVPKTPEQIEVQSTSPYESETVTKLDDTEPFVTEKQYVSNSDQETPNFPVVSEEQSTSRIDTESVTKMEDSGSDHEETSSHKLDTGITKPEQDSENTDKVNTEPLTYPETTIRSELEGSGLFIPSEDIAVVPQKEDSPGIGTTVSTFIPQKVETPIKTDTEIIDDFEKYSTEQNVQTSIPAEETVTLHEDTDAKPYEIDHKTPSKLSTEDESIYSETTPYSVLLEEHTHPVLEDTSSIIPIEEGSTTVRNEVQPERGDQIPDTPEINDEYERTTIKQIEEERTTSYDKISSPIVHSSDAAETTTTVEKITSGTGIQDEDKQYSPSMQDDGVTTPIVLPTIKDKEQDTTSPTTLEKEITTLGSILASSSKPELISSSSKDTQELSPTSTSKLQEESTTHSPPSEDKYTEKPLVSSPSSSEIPDILGEPHEDEHLPDFPPSDTGTPYGQEPDYVEEDQSFGPGTCRYGGKVYVSAQQIPRDDPCDFCFCFRSDIICLQQSCPPPIHGCHEEPIQGFCCPRYECPVSMATTMNITTTTTTTTTTLPPHFLPHAYKGAAQRRGCQIKGHSYKVGEVVRASSGPCLHCTCGGDGQMKCDPKACTPEPMLRQMIAAAVSAKRRR